MSINYSPTILSYTSVETGDSRILTAKVSSSQISNDTERTMIIGGGSGSYYSYREQGDVTWLDTGTLDLTHLWKTETDGTKTDMRYAAIEHLDDSFYLLRWEDDEVTVLETDVDGSVTQSVTLDAHNHPFMKVYDSYVVVAHTDATGNIGVVTRLVRSDFATSSSVNFLDGATTASTITGFHANYINLTDEPWFIAVCGVTDHATNTHAIGVIQVRNMPTGSFDIYHGTDEHTSLNISSGLASSTEMILAGRDAGGFTTLLYNTISGFTTGVASELSHRTSGTDCWSMAYADSFFYPTVTNSSTSSSNYKLKQKLGGYSTAITASYNDPVVVDNQSTFSTYLRFTGEIPSGSATDIAVFKDGVTTKHTLYVKATGEVALKDASSTEIWTTTETLDSVGYEGFDSSSDHLFDLSRRLDSTGAVVWALSVLGGDMTISVTNSVSSLDIGDLVSLPITGTYSSLIVKHGVDGVIMTFDQYADMTACSLGSCSSTIEPAATVYQDYDSASTTMVQNAIGQTTEIHDGYIYVSGRTPFVVQAQMGRINMSTREWSVSDGLSAVVGATFAGTAFYNGRLYVPYLYPTDANTASVAVMTEEFVLDSFVTVEIRFAPTATGWYTDVFIESVLEPSPGIQLNGYAESTIDLGLTPYGIVMYEEGHRDYYAFAAATPTTQDVNTYVKNVSNQGDYIYDSGASAFIETAVAGTGTHDLVVDTINVQEALDDYEAYIDTVNVYYAVNADKAVDMVEHRALVKFATSLVKSKLYFTPDANYNYDEDEYDVSDVGDETETGQIPATYDANNPDTYCIATKQIEIIDYPLNGRINKALKIRVEAYLGDSGEERYDDFKVFEINLLPSDSFNIGGSDA